LTPPAPPDLRDADFIANKWAIILNKYVQNIDIGYLGSCAKLRLQRPLGHNTVEAPFKGPLFPRAIAAQQEKDQITEGKHKKNVSLTSTE
jgi:hypothetical protein